MIDTEILEDYSSEARELLDEIDHSLIRLEKEGGIPELLNNIFRAVHCIKGSAQYIGLDKSSTLTHGVENLLDRLREGQLPFNPSIMDFLFRSKDLIASLVEEVAETREEKSEISGMMEQLEQILQGGSEVQAESIAPQETALDQSDVDSGLLAALSEPDFEPESTASTVSEPDDEIKSKTELIPSIEAESFNELTPDESAMPDEEIEGLGTPSFFTLEDTEEIRSRSSETAQLIEHGSPSLVETPVEHPPPSEALEESLPHLLTLALYLDDFQDGFLQPNEIVSSFLGTLESLKGCLTAAGIPPAVDIVEKLHARIVSLDAEKGDFSREEIERLHAYLYDLRSYYPENLFPLSDRGASSVPSEEPSDFLPVETPFPKEEEAFQETPLFEQPSVFSPQATLDTEQETITATEVIPPSSMPYPIAGRTMMADVDDDLLSQFENEFGSLAPAVEAPPIPSIPAALVPPQVDPPRVDQRFTDLAEDLDMNAEDLDREIMEIFFGYGMEIITKLDHLVRQVIAEPASAQLLDDCADLINSARSSAAYMDYQKIALFLDTWHEDVQSAVERAESSVPVDVAFMSENFNLFQAFLKSLHKNLYPNESPDASLTTPIPRLVASPSPSVSPVSPVKQAPPDTPASPTLSAPNPKPQPEVSPKAMTEPTPPLPVQAEKAPETVVQAEGKPIETIEETMPVSEVRVRESVDAPSSMARDLLDGAVVKTMRVDSAKVDTLLNQVGELVVNRSYVEQLSLELKQFHRSLMTVNQISKKEIQTVKELALKVGEASVALGRAATDIQEGVMKLRMLPVGQLFNRMPRLIRDLSHRIGKEVNLEVHGADTEVDKRVIEQIYNPLVHLIRNAVDHGIEDKKTRKLLGKREEGLIILRAYSQGNQVTIDVEDDGGGIRRNLVLDRAIAHRLIDPQEAPNLGSQDVFNILFLPGFSTSKSVTRTSGRGVGMDVVQKDVEKINGHVDIDSWEGEGTKISIKIPLTLAIIQTLLIRSMGHVFAIPLTTVREIIQISAHEIITIEGFEVIKFREETVPVLRVNEVFNLEQSESKKEAKFLVLASTGSRTIGFLVEDLIGEQDVVIKPLADHVFKNRGLAGSTILGDGTIALVLDVGQLIEDILTQQRYVGMQPGRFISSEPQSQVTQSLEM